MSGGPGLLVLCPGNNTAIVSLLMAAAATRPDVPLHIQSTGAAVTDPFLPQHCASWPFFAGVVVALPLDQVEQAYHPRLVSGMAADPQEESCFPVLVLALGGTPPALPERRGFVFRALGLGWGRDRQLDTVADGLYHLVALHCRRRSLPPPCIPPSDLYPGGLRLPFRPLLHSTSEHGTAEHVAPRPVRPDAR